MMKIKIWMLLVPVFFSGCAAMSVDECKTANWSAVGEKDGSNGHEMRLNQYYKACSKANIVPNQALYEQGYRTGQRFYCQPDTIFYAALKGNGNYQVCPAESRATLRPYYQVAYAYYTAENEYQRYQSDYKEYTQRAYDTKLKQEERDRYQKMLKDLQNDSDRINRDYREAIRDLERFKVLHGLN